MLDFIHLLITPSIYHLLFTSLVLLLISFNKLNVRKLVNYRLYIFIFTLYIYVISLPVVSNSLLYHLEHKYEKPLILSDAENSAIIVLSSGRSRITNGRRETVMDLESWERIYTAVLLWNQIGGKVIISGSGVDPRSTAISKLMADKAILMGVPKSALLIEDQSLNTYQNFIYIKQLIKPFINNVYLVTSALHMHRSVLVARKLGINVIPYPCDYRSFDYMGLSGFVPKGSTIGVWQNVLHEWLGIFAYSLTDRI